MTYSALSHLQCPRCGRQRDADVLTNLCECGSPLLAHPKVAEAAVVGATDETTGQAVCAFVILRSEAGDGGPDVVRELREHVATEIGKMDLIEANLAEGKNTEERSPPLLAQSSGSTR